MIDHAAHHKGITHFDMYASGKRGLTYCKDRIEVGSRWACLRVSNRGMVGFWLGDVPPMTLLLPEAMIASRFDE